MARVQLQRREREVIGVWNAQTLADAIEALQEMADEAKRAGHDPDTVYLDKRRFTLVAEPLMDQSEVLNVYFFDGE